MKKCWKMDPTDRPSFTALVESLGKILAAIAGYVELSMTLHPTEEEVKSEEMGPSNVSSGKLDTRLVIMWGLLPLMICFMLLCSWCRYYSEGQSRQHWIHVQSGVWPFHEWGHLQCRPSHHDISHWWVWGCYWQPSCWLDFLHFKKSVTGLLYQTENSL